MTFQLRQREPPDAAQSVDSQSHGGDLPLQVCPHCHSFPTNPIIVDLLLSWMFAAKIVYWDLQYKINQKKVHPGSNGFSTIVETCDRPMSEPDRCSRMRTKVSQRQTAHAIVKHAILPLPFAFHLASLFKGMRNRLLLRPIRQNSSPLSLPRLGCQYHTCTDILHRFLWGCPLWPNNHLPLSSLCRPRSSSPAMESWATVEWVRWPDSAESWYAGNQYRGNSGCRGAPEEHLPQENG